MPRKLSILLLGLLAGIAGGALFQVIVRSTTRAERVEAVGLPESHSDLLAVQELIRALDQRVARIEAGLSSRETSSTREPMKAAASSIDTAEPSAASSKELAALRTDLVRVSERLAVTEEGLKDSGLRWVRNPTAEQLQRARKDVNWGLVDEINRTCRDSYPAGFERVSAMTIEDVLSQIGMPTRMGQGVWFYVRALDPAATGDEFGISLSFSGDHVAGVSWIGLR